jgi:hypothetical protein
MFSKSILRCLAGAILLVSGAANAVIYPVSPTSPGALNPPQDLGVLNNPSNAITGSDFPGSNATFLDAFNFSLFTPPNLTGVDTVSVNVSPPVAGRGIDNLTFTWLVNNVDTVTGAGVYQTTAVTDGSGAPLQNLIVTSFIQNAGQLLYYILEVSGTALSSPVSEYSFIMTGGQGGNQIVPLPGALVLFGTVLAGAGLFIRRRRRDCGSALPV